MLHSCSQGFVTMSSVWAQAQDPDGFALLLLSLFCSHTRLDSVYLRPLRRRTCVWEMDIAVTMC